MDIKTKLERDSNFEALRIIAMFCIILYHLLLYYIDSLSNHDIFFNALQIPLHIGVILFVLISGYYGIKSNVKGAILLLLPIAIYYVPLELVKSIYDGNIHNAIKSLLFFSYSPYWYVRTYFYLYLISPIINTYLNSTNNRNISLLTIMLLVVCIWLGLNKGDSSLEHGKNILYFLALYMLGNRINFYLRGDVKIDKFKLIIAYIILNILIVLTYLATGLMMQSVIIKLCFMYCSPLLLLNALLMFLIFTNIKFENIFVNKVAKSTYSMYIIHNSPVVLSVLISPIITKIWAMGGGKIFLLVNLIVLTLIIMCMCYLIDSIIRPFMNKYASKASVYIIEKLSSDR